jgi:hypothetical protein
VPSPTQLNVTITQNANGVITTSVVVVPIPAGLQALDSTTPGSTQTGHSAADELIRNIFRSGLFTDGVGNWYPAFVIQKITAQ